MTLDALSNDILVHELQLGEQLSESVHHDRRADFSLLLAMLTDDVRAHSQFKLPLSQTTEKITTSEQLRKYFQLPNEASIALNNVEDITMYNQASLIELQQLEHLRLTNSLNPRPLVFRDDAKHISQSVMTNTSLYCQQKYQNKSIEKTQQRTDFNAQAWLAAVQTTIVKAPLMDAVA